MTIIKNNSKADKDVVVGFDDDLLAIKQQLCGASSRRQVIPIVGMGGIGKATLASTAYHDQLIREVFHIGRWVTVSQSYSLEDILSRLHQSLQPFNAIRLKESHESGEGVSEKEKGDSRQSNEYAAEMPGNRTEDSKVESESPAKTLQQSPDYVEELVYKTLKGKKYLIVMDDIWNTEVFDHLNSLFPDDINGSRVILSTRLRDVATYAKDCSPHKMQLMSEDQSWNLLQHKVFINVVCDQELRDIGMAVARSCGGLPLAIVVIAGLLASVEKTRASWEEIAKKVSSKAAAKDSHFEKILSLSYTHLPLHLRQCFAYMGGFPEDQEIQVATLIKLWIAEGFIDVITASRSLEEKARDCLQDLIKRSLVLVGLRKPHGEMKSCRLHDLMRDLCIRQADAEKFPIYDTDIYESYAKIFEVDSLEEVRYPRVIDFGDCVPSPSLIGPELYTLAPEKKFRLSNLRYISLAHYVDIPAAISCLENLQTFIIYPMEGLVRLPPEIWEMPQLRHLVSSFDPLPYPEGEARMKNLQNLENLHQLEKLKMRAYPGFQGILNPVFPLSLKKLSLSGWILPSWNDMKIVGSLPNLQVLKLRHSGGQDKRWETAQGEFARLSFLLIEGSGLQEWVTEPEHFPNLKQMLLHCCWFLNEIPGNLPNTEVANIQ